MNGPARHPVLSTGVQYFREIGQVIPRRTFLCSRVAIRASFRLVASLLQQRFSHQRNLNPDRPDCSTVCSTTVELSGSETRHRLSFKVLSARRMSAYFQIDRPEFLSHSGLLMGIDSLSCVSCRKGGLPPDRAIPDTSTQRTSTLR